MLLFIILCLYGGILPSINGFAYAPNFITKIIESSSGIEPVGLLDITPSKTTDDNDGSQITSVQEEVPVVEVGEEREGREDDIVVKGPITTRFPPEPNGYLHLGHAKAVSFNFAVARAFQGSDTTNSSEEVKEEERGRCHMRLDDTNPTKEDEEYVYSILEDVNWIQRGLSPFTSNLEVSEKEQGPWYGPVRKTSDYFHTIYETAIYLIQSGEAFVDELSADEMREYRGSLTEGGQESPYRNRSIDDNLKLFTEMKEGKHPDGKYVLRAKIDMSSPNLNMRDPVLYRIKHEHHQATGDEWCIYPMYDFSHPISDAIENITHSLCTLEFEDHRPLYDWVIERIVQGNIVTSSPRQIEFSRLNLKYTVLSKRKLIKLVDEQYVTGWDDPRMPTLSGVRRRGFPPSSIRLFCERMGISKSDSNIDATILEDCAREVLDEDSPRAFAILDPLKVTITNWEDDLEEFNVPRHPKRNELGERTVPFGQTVYIERSDYFDLDGPEGQANDNKPPRGFKRLLPNEKVRLKYAYVIKCDEVVRDPSTNEPIELKCTYYPETRAGVTPEGEARVKGIIQWVEASTSSKVQVMQYDRLFKAEEPGKESGDFTTDINKDSLKIIKNVVVEPSVAKDALDTIASISDNKSSEDKMYHSDLTYQFERSGYFALDSSSTDNNLVFNRVVTLRDTWNAPPPRKAKQPKNQQDNNQKKGRGGGGQAPVVEDARRIALRAGTILEAGPHPEADSLIVCKLDCGDFKEDGEADEPRTVVAGLAGKISFDDLVNKKVVCIANLKPAKMRGIESTAMLLAASDGKEGDDETVQLLDVPDSVPNGELLSFEGKEIGEPDGMLKSKGALKVWDRVKAKLRVNDGGEATYADEDGTVRKIMTSGGPVKVSSLTDCIIG